MEMQILIILCKYETENTAIAEVYRFCTFVLIQQVKIQILPHYVLATEKKRNKKEATQAVCAAQI